MAAVLATYWLSFRIDEDKTDKGYGRDRRSALYEAVKDLDSEPWDGSTSFIIFKSDLGINRISKIFRKCVSPDIDTVLLRQINGKPMVFIGIKKEFEKLSTIVPDSHHLQ